MTTVVSVKFRDNEKAYFFDPNGSSPKQGEKVVVETVKGLEMGECCRECHEVEDDQIVPPLRPVIRIATAADLRVAEANKEREREAFDICRQKIADHGLEMKLVSVERSFDGSKILFFFTSDGRVDFRELVKDLASVFRTRIELRQIGVRDEAKMLGGIGICGRPFCCSQFLTDFQPVSTKMAKVQSMSLNPSKISGTCGRLMCCLRYEQEAYEELVKNVPKQGAFVETPDGYGNVTQINLLRQLVKVKLDGEGDDTVKTFRSVEVATVPGGRPKDGEAPPSVLKYVPEPEPEPEIENEWALPQLFSEDYSPEESQPEEKPTKNRRNRRHRQKPKTGDKKQPSEKKPTEKKEQPKTPAETHEKQTVRAKPKHSGNKKQKKPDAPKEKAAKPTAAHEAKPATVREAKPAEAPAANEAAPKKNNRRRYYRHGKPKNKQGGEGAKQ